MTVKEIRLLICLVLTIALGYWGYAKYQDWQETKRLAAQHKTYVESVENRKEVSQAARDAFYEQNLAAAARKNRSKKARVEAAAITEKVADENQDVRDFLDARIPDELRDADRKARESRGLEAGGRAR